MISMSQRQLNIGIALATTLAISLPAFASATEKAPLTALTSLRWQHRIILVEAQIPDAVERLRAARPAINKRDIVSFALSSDELLSNYPGDIGGALAQHLN